MYNLLLSAASAVALNKHHRFLFLYNFKSECVNMAWLYVLYVLKVKLSLQNDPVSKSFLLRNLTTLYQQ